MESLPILIAIIVATLVISGVVFLASKRQAPEESSREADLQEELTALKVELAEERQKLKNATETHARVSEVLEKAQAQAEALQQDYNTLFADHERLQETLKQESRQAGEKLDLLKEARTEMSQQFKVMAEEVMKQHGETFKQQNKEQIGSLVNPLREKIAEFQQGLQTAQTESAKDRASLAQQIRQLSEDSAKMTLETSNLTRALKGKTQTQGAWGEMILASILESSGLREGQEYVTQESHTAENGRRLRPDVIVNLPNHERIIIDSKVSLKAFEGYVNAESDEERAANLTLHQQSIANHIKGLSSKNYQTETANSLDFVIMFVPIEGALAVALQENPALTAQAAEANVAIATPTTLMMALRTVSSLWQVERRNQNAEAIAERAGKLYDKFVGFAKNMELVGDRLNSSRDAFDKAMGQMSSGPGNITRQIEQLKNMGAKTSKSLPPQLLEASEADSLELEPPPKA